MRLREVRMQPTMFLDYANGGWQQVHTSRELGFSQAVWAEKRDGPVHVKFTLTDTGEELPDRDALLAALRARGHDIEP